MRRGMNRRELRTHKPRGSGFAGSVRFGPTGLARKRGSKSPPPPKRGTQGVTRVSGHPSRPCISGWPLPPLLLISRAGARRRPFEAQAWPPMECKQPSPSCPSKKGTIRELGERCQCTSSDILPAGFREPDLYPRAWPVGLARCSCLRSFSAVRAILAKGWDVTRNCPSCSDDPNPQRFSYLNCKPAQE